MIRVQPTDGFAVEFPLLKKDLLRHINNMGEYLDYVRATGSKEDYCKVKAYYDAFVKAYEENK